MTTKEEMEAKFRSKALTGNSTVVALLEVLVEQGVLTEEQVQDVRKRAMAKTEMYLDELQKN